MLGPDGEDRSQMVRQPPSFGDNARPWAPSVLRGRGAAQRTIGSGASAKNAEPETVYGPAGERMLGLHVIAGYTRQDMEQIW